MKQLNLEEFTSVIEKYPIRLGICFNVDGRKIYGYHENEKFDTACGIMVFILLEYVNQLFAGNFSGKELLTYNEDNFATGSGIIKCLPFGSQVRMEDAVELMISASDHVAANLLIDALGMDSINDTIKKYGFLNTRLARKFLIPKVKNMGTSSPMEFTQFFTLLKRGLLISVDASEIMKKILLKQKYKDILAGKIFELPLKTFLIDVASKSGKADGKIYDDTTNSYIVDGGIIYTKKGSYEISLFAEMNYDSKLSLNHVKSFMQDISANFFTIFLQRY